MGKLKQLYISNFITEKGKTVPIELSYQTFGKSLATAPIVMVNHALTGNSNVCGELGWWNQLIGPGKCIDTNVYTVLAFNIPGNGFGKSNFQIENYHDFVAKDIAKIFALGLEQLNIKALFAVIGGSVGGGLAWELAILRPKLIEHLIPVASDWKATDWLIANCMLQDRILNNSRQPIEDARIHAMMCYRSPQSFKLKFDRTLHNELGVFNIESWLLHHGEKLRSRFQLSAYKLINQLLKTIDISRGYENFEAAAQALESHVHIVSINTDLFFIPEENRQTFKALYIMEKKVSFYEIKSNHGHDAFLIEFEQLSALLNAIFKKNSIKVA